MQNRTSNIELPSNSRPSRPSRSSEAQNLTFARNNHHNYHPQQDEESRAEPQRQSDQPQRPQSSGLEGKFEACIKKMCTVNFEKASKIASLLMTFFFLIDFIPLIYFAIQEEQPYTEEIQGALESMSANLMADPIMDLQIIDKKFTCPSGYEALEFGVWNGTVAGCLCENGHLSSSPCTNDDHAKKCKTIPAVLPLEINERDGLIWCGKRAILGTDYVKQAECPAQYQECYTGGCFINECPITKVEIAFTGEATKKISFTKEKYLILTREQGEFPLINVQITPTDIPCFNQRLHAKPTKKKSSFKLLALNESGCDKYGLDSYLSKQLYSQPVFDSFTQNTFRYSTMNLPDYEKYAKNTTSITSWRVRMMTEKNDHCLNLDKKLVEKSMKAFNRSFISDKAFTTAFGNHIGFFIGMALLFCFCGGECLPVSESLMSARVLLCLVTGYFPLIFWALRRIDDAQILKMTIKDFVLYDSLECFEDGQSQGNLVISDSLELLKMGEMNFFMGFGLLISYGLAILVCVCYLLMSKVSSQENSNPSNPSRL